MAQVSLPPDGPYARRVSFNNLHPDDLETHTSKFYQYNMSEPTSHATDLNVSKMFGNYSLGGVAQSVVLRKRVKLPDPPSKLILKNKLTPAQLSQNLQYAMLLGVSYHGDLAEMVQHPVEGTPLLDPGEPPQLDKSPNDSEDEMLPPPPPSGRRKLYSGMTDEELMALDPQFNKPRTNSIDNFKFDLTTTYYSSARRLSTTAQVTQPVVKQIPYPLLNENNYKSISLTVKHHDYDADTEMTRTLLTVISGRKHTWNALDWLLLTDPNLKDTPRFLQDGDYLVVAALVPLKYILNDTSKKPHAVDDKLFKQCDNLLKYVLDNLPENLKLKVTVEFVLDVPPMDPLAPNYKKNAPTGAKFMLTNLFRQYHPTLVVVGNKSTNLNFKYPIRKRRQKSLLAPPPPALPGLAKIQLAPPTIDAVEAHLIKLLSFLIKYSTVPVILVGNSTVFHKKIEIKQNTAVTFSSDVHPSKSILDVAPRTERKNSAVSEDSIESFVGYTESDDVLLETPEELRGSLDEIAASGSAMRFADMLSKVSLYLLEHLKNYLNIVNDDTIERLSPQILNSKVHQVYQSIGSGKLLSSTHSNGGNGVYKVKSLISYSEEEEKKNEKMINDKKLKKTVSRALMVSQKSDDKKPKKKSLFQKLGMKK